MRESELNYYCQQGSISDPGSFKDLLGKFPQEIVKLSEAIHRVLLIDFLPNMGIVKVPEEHLTDVNIRGMAAKLEKILARDDADISHERNFETVLLGNCRDLSLMLCSVLRNYDISARLRSGFATFFPEKYYDHWVCEYWNPSEQRWIKVDPWMSQIQYRKDILPAQLSAGLLELNYNPYDVEDKYFITGGDAWINCREKGDNPDNYGTYEEELKGTWFVRDNMIRDLLCLNKIEPLPWDCWGLMGRENKDIKDEILVVLDEIAHDINGAKSTPLEKLEMLEISKSFLDSLT